MGIVTCFSGNTSVESRILRMEWKRPFRLLPAANEVWGKVIFLQVSVILSTQGVCVVALGGGVCGCSWGGMHGCSGGVGHAWLLWGACMAALGGMHGCSGGVCGCSGGACVVAPGGACVIARGHAWLLPGGCVVAWGVCMVAPRGACMVVLGGHAWDSTRYGDKINERAVHILLECILVTFFFILHYSK